MGLNTLSINAFGCTSHLGNVMVVTRGILRQWRFIAHFPSMRSLYEYTLGWLLGPPLFFRCFLGKQCSVWIRLYKYSESKAAQCQIYLLFRGFVGLVTLTFRGDANQNVYHLSIIILCIEYSQHLDDNFILLEDSGLPHESGCPWLAVWGRVASYTRSLWDGMKH